MNENDELEIEAYILTRLQRLNAVVNGIDIGLVTGSVIYNFIVELRQPRKTAGNGNRD